MEELLRKQRQFLIHSFIYYKLNEDIISDIEYDIICKRMNDLMKNNLKAKQSPYHKICLPCGDTGSGYYIQNYPEEIITRSLHLLYQYKKPNEEFGQFVGRWGYHLI